MNIYGFRTRARAGPADDEVKTTSIHMVFCPQELLAVGTRRKLDGGHQLHSQIWIGQGSHGLPLLSLWHSTVAVHALDRLQLDIVDTVHGRLIVSMTRSETNVQSNELQVL